MKKTCLWILIAAIGLTGCITNYQYRSDGVVSMSDGTNRGAVLYWHKDEGRLWYGKKYEQTDTSLTMRICESTPKIFALGNLSHVELQSKDGDIRIARINDRGEVEKIPKSERLRTGDSCGAILAGSTPVGTEGLAVGAKPTANILCINKKVPDRYPKVAAHSFGAVSRKESDAMGTAPDPCKVIARD